MRSKIHRLIAPLLALGLFPGPGGPAWAADQISLGDGAANAGTSGVSIDASITNDRPIHAFSLALTFDPTFLTLKRIGPEGTESALLNAEFFHPTINNTTGTAHLGVIFSYNDDPFTRVELEASPDAPRRVAVLTFDIAAGAPPGDYPIELVNGIGSPPISNVFSTEGRSTRPAIEGGAIIVNNLNHLMLDSPKVLPGSRFEVKASAKHPATLQGFSIALLYDKTILTFVDATWAGTAAALAIRPQIIEFFQPEVDLQFSPTQARLSVGAVVDFVPPFTGQEIPASPEQYQSLTRILMSSQQNPALIGTCTELVFHNGGVSSVNNILIVDKESHLPSLVNGRVCFVNAPAFRRGMVNADSRIDISDGIAILGHLFLGLEAPACLAAGDLNDDNRFDVSDAVALFMYLFSGGTAPREPFTACGSDPTPGGLTCEDSTRCQ